MQILKNINYAIQKPYNLTRTYELFLTIVRNDHRKAEL